MLMMVYIFIYSCMQVIQVLSILAMPKCMSEGHGVRVKVYNKAESSK